MIWMQSLGMNMSWITMSETITNISYAGKNLRKQPLVKWMERPRAALGGGGGVNLGHRTIPEIS